MLKPLKTTPLLATAGYELLDELGSAHINEGWDWVPLRDDADTTIIRVLVARGQIETRAPAHGGILHARVTRRGYATLQHFFDRPC